MLVACAAAVNGEVRNMQLVGQSSSEVDTEAVTGSLCSYIEDGLDWMPNSTSCSTSTTSPVSCSTKSGSSPVLCNITLDIEFNSSNSNYWNDGALIYLYQSLVSSWVGNNSFGFSEMLPVYDTIDTSIQRDLLLEFLGLNTSLLQESSVSDLVDFVDLVCTSIMEILNDHVNTGDYGTRCLLYKILDVELSVGVFVRVTFTPETGAAGMDAFTAYVHSSANMLFNLSGVLQNVTEVIPIIPPISESIQRDMFLEFAPFNFSQLIDYEIDSDRYSSHPRRLEVVEKICQLLTEYATASNLKVCNVYAWTYGEQSNTTEWDSAIRLTYPTDEDVYWMDATTTYLTAHVNSSDTNFTFSDDVSTLQVLHPDPEMEQRDIQLEFGGDFNYTDFDSGSFEYRATFVQEVCLAVTSDEGSVRRCNMFAWMPGTQSIITSIRLTFSGISSSAMDSFASNAISNITAFNKAYALRDYNITRVNNMSLSFDSQPPPPASPSEDPVVDLSVQREVFLRMVGQLPGGTETSYFTDMMAQPAEFKQSFNNSVTNLVKEAASLAKSVWLYKWDEGSIVMAFIITFSAGTTVEEMTAALNSVLAQASSFSSKLTAFGVTSVTGFVLDLPPDNSDDGDSGSDDGDSKSLAIGLGVGLGVGIPLVASVIIYCIWKRRQGQTISPGQSA